MNVLAVLGAVVVLVVSLSGESRGSQDLQYFLPGVAGPGWPRIKRGRARSRKTGGPTGPQSGPGRHNLQHQLGWAGLGQDTTRPPPWRDIANI